MFAGAVFGRHSSQTGGVSAEWHGTGDRCGGGGEGVAVEMVVVVLPQRLGEPQGSDAEPTEPQSRSSTQGEARPGESCKAFRQAARGAKGFGSSR